MSVSAFVWLSVLAFPQQAGRTQKPFVPYLTSLPNAFVEAANFMFDDGLADPRECEYRYVVVRVPNSLRDETTEVRTRAWLVNGTGEDKRAICWDGQIYDVAELGGSAFLNSDMQRIGNGYYSVAEWKEGVDRSGYPSFVQGTPIGAALMYRLGHDYGAQELLTKSTWSGADGVWLSLFQQCVLSNYHRGVAEYLRSEDARALEHLDRAAKFVGHANKFLADLPRERARDTYMFNPPDNVHTLRDVVHDRVENPDKLVRFWSKVEERDKLRQLFIRLVDAGGIAWRPYGEHPVLPPLDIDTFLTEHPFAPADSVERSEYIGNIWQAIVDECEKNLPAAIEVAKTEKFGSRHLSSRGFVSSGPLGYVHPLRYFPTVAEIATNVVASIVHPEEAQGLAPADSPLDAARAFWDKYGAIPTPERYAAVVRDPERPAAAWVESLTRLTSFYYRADQPTTLLYDAFLTDKVVDGLFKTLEERFAQAQTFGYLPLKSAVDLAKSAYYLDPQRSLPYLQHAMRSISFNLEIKTDVGASARDLQVLAALRLQLGDDGAAGEYVTALPRITAFGGRSPNLRDAHATLFLFADRDEIKSALAELLNNAIEAVGSETYHPQLSADEFAPWIVVPELRPKIKALLADQRQIATIETKQITGGYLPDWSQRYWILAEVKYRSSTSNNSVALESREEWEDSVGTKTTLRVMDAVAKSLSDGKVGPRFEIFWPQEKRDAAIAQIIAAVERADFQMKDTASFRFDFPWWYSCEPVYFRSKH